MEQWKDQNRKVPSWKSIKADREMPVAKKEDCVHNKENNYVEIEREGENDIPLMFIKHAVFL